MSNMGNANSDKDYKKLTSEERQFQIDKILEVWNDFLAINDPDLKESDVFINKRSLAEAVERVSKRKYYYEVFHQLYHISEYKEVALYVFWITKLKPFTIVKETSPLCASVNELFAVHMILSIFEKVRKAAKSCNFTYPSQAMISDFIYGLKYQDFTKEAMIVYVEALASACGLPVFSSSPIHE